MGHGGQGRCKPCKSGMASCATPTRKHAAARQVRGPGTSISAPSDWTRTLEALEALEAPLRNMSPREVLIRKHLKHPLRNAIPTYLCQYSCYLYILAFVRYWGISEDPFVLSDSRLDPWLSRRGPVRSRRSIYLARCVARCDPLADEIMYDSSTRKRGFSHSIVLLIHLCPSVGEQPRKLSSAVA